MRVRVLCLLLPVLLAACGPSEAELQETMVAASSHAIATFSAQLTETALHNPSSTPTKPPTSTPVAATPEPTSTQAAASTGTAFVNTCDRMRFIADVTIQDEEEVPAGATFNKVWAVHNNGTCDWTPEYRLRFSDGEQMNGPNNKYLEMVVAADDTAHLTLTLRAPEIPGKHTGHWTLVNPAGEAFGYLTIVIRVP